MRQIITSILDTDLYKLTMQYAVISKFPHETVRYNFINRNKTKFPHGFDIVLKEQINLMKNISLSKDEKYFLHSQCPYLPIYYLNYLEKYRFNPDELNINLSKEGDLSIIIEGKYHSVIMWEVPLMSLISELYYIETNKTDNIYNSRERTLNNKDKANFFSLINVNVSEFGTRRRFSKSIQEELIYDFNNYNKNTLDYKFLKGTSNVKLAMDYNLTPIGTQAHEWIMFHGAKYGYINANKLSLENWVNVYKDQLLVALTDTYTTDVFFSEFDYSLSSKFTGIRHDSDDPFIFVDKTINHYKKLGIDPMTKFIIFSDSLNPDKALEIKKYCEGKINCSFGIGTNLTNDVGVEPLNMVIKLSHILNEGKWKSCVKLSDSKTKHTGDVEEVSICKETLNIN